MKQLSKDIQITRNQFKHYKSAAMRYRLLKSQRLLSNEQFACVFNCVNNSKVGARELTLIYTNNKVSHPRIGLIVSKKVSKKAVERNRLKRIMRESFRIMQHDIPNIDIVVIAKYQANTLDNIGLFKKLSFLFSKLQTCNSSLIKNN